MPPAATVPHRSDGAASESTLAEEGDSNVRSVKEVTGYTISATDGEIGHVEDFIAETDTWKIRYMIIDTRNWWLGKHVLVSPSWVERVLWAERRVCVDMSRDRIKGAPEYEPSLPLSREYEVRLHDFYGVPGYWKR